MTDEKREIERETKTEILKGSNTERDRMAKQDREVKTGKE